MFSDYITSPIPPLTPGYFSAINRPESEPDYTLSCLAYVMLKPRIPEYSGLFGRMSKTLHPELVRTDAILKLEERQEMSSEDRLKRPCLRQYICQNNEAIRTGLTTAGMKEIPQIGAYIRQEVNMDGAALFVHKDLNYAVMISPTGDIRVYHLMIAFLHLMFPAVFENSPPTADEMALAKTLTCRTSGKFVSAIGAALKHEQKEILRFELSQCFRGFRQQKIEQADRNVRQLRVQLEEQINAYRRTMDQIETAVIFAEGLRVVNSDTNNKSEMEAVEYIAGCPRLHAVSYNDDGGDGLLRFDVDTILTNFDVLKWRNAVSTKDIYSNYRLEENSPFYNKASRKLFLDALFGSNNPELAVKIRGRFALNPSRAWMDVGKGADFRDSDEELRNCVSNPHFDRHGCPGQNRDQVLACLRQLDIVSAIECCIAATGSVNINETEITFRPFVQEILTSTNKIIRRSDGVDMTPAEALLWLMKKEEEKQAA